MKPVPLSRLSEWLILVLLALSILWRGGKGLEMVWLSALVAAFITIVYALKRLVGIPTGEPDQPAQSKNAEVPFVLWAMVLANIVLTVLSYLHSSTRNYGLDAVLRLISFSLIFFWTVRCALDGKLHRLLARTVRVVTWASCLAVAIGIVVYVFHPVNRFVGTFFDYRFTTDYWPNAWGEFTLLAWPLMIIYWVQTKEVRLGRLLLVAIGLMMGSLLLSYSRGAILALILQMIFMSVLLAYLALRDIRYRRTVRSLRTRFVLRTLGVAAIAVGLFLGVNAVRSQFHEVQSVQQKVTFTASEGTSSISERDQFWHQAFALSKDHLLLGYGPYSFRFVQPRLAEGVLATSDHAHNVILNSALERGWPAALLGVLIVLYIVFTSIRTLLTTRREWSQERDITTVMLLVAVIGVYGHNLIDFNLQFVSLSLHFWLCLGFLVVPVTSRHGSALTSFSRWKRSRYLFWLKLALASCLLTVTVSEGIFLGLSSLGRHAEAQGRTNDALHWYALARHEWFSRDMHLSEAQLYLKKDDPTDALKALNLYQRENPFDARAWKLRGLVLLRTHAYADASRALARAYEQGKYTDLGILEAWLQTDRDPKAREELISRKMEFDTLFSDYADAIERNTHFIALSANVESLLSVSRELSQLFPTDEKRYKQIARRAYEHAQKERKIYTSHATGMLW